ncbi:FMN-binding protein [bacterium 1XD8-76]|nr:FMN-binding protein [bacterium 1XD8-76]
MWKKKIMLLSAVILSLCLAGCGSEKGMKNGYYTAEMKEYDYGWKEYVCIFVKNDKIVSIEFNAKNPSGFIKAWDNAYMENMKPVSGTYPNEYTRLYGTRLLESQDIEAVDAVTGATSSGEHFYKLVNAAMEQAREGNSEVAVVE